MSEPVKCLNPNCNSKRNSRGLCHSCYQTARVLIESGKTTWEHLEKAGKSLPPNTRSSPNGSIKRWLLEEPK